MRKSIIFCIFVGFVLSGCVFTKPAFTIESSASDKSSKSIYSLNNRLSPKSLPGNYHIDEKGVYIDPSAFITQYDDIGTSLLINHYTHINNFNDIAGFEPIHEVILIVNDKEKITINLKPLKQNIKNIKFSRVSKNTSADFHGAASGDISLEDFNKLAHAKKLDVKIIAGTGSQTYSNKELEKDFISNLKQFYDKLETLKK